jgi:hypothetical protein
MEARQGATAKSESLVGHPAQANMLQTQVGAQEERSAG